jgi:ParB-like chromosome segregation protein Spo0J
MNLTPARKVLTPRGVIGDAPISALIPYLGNPWTHSDAQIARVAASIQEFGWTNPILVDGENGIIAGHARVEAARKLGLSNVPVIELKCLHRSRRCPGAA